MSYEIHEHSKNMHDCPKCGKRSLAEMGGGRFHCIWCGFRRDVGDAEHSYLGQFLGNITLVAALVFILGNLLQPNFGPREPVTEPRLGNKEQPEQLASSSPAAP